jgi:hypothetical protein
MTKNVTDEQLGILARLEHEIFRRVREGTLPVEQVLAGLQRLIEGDFGGSPYRGGPSGGEKPDLITVPSLSAAEIVAEAKRKLKLTYLNEEDYASYDFVRDEAGETFEVLVWKPGRYVTTEEMRKHFAELKADGNPVAFIAWITKHDPRGYHASIPSDDSRLYCNPKSDELYAPGFYNDRHGRVLDVRCVDDEWDDDWSFVAFREVQV